jgi:hypothetical protein
MESDNLARRINHRFAAKSFSFAFGFGFKSEHTDGNRKNV